MKIPCEMIQDLIPSYVEEICSKTSIKYVEEHMKECVECRELVQLYKEKDFSADCLEKKQLDGLKKLKKNITLQSIFSYALLLLLIGFGIYNFEVNYNKVSVNLYYVLFVISLVATYVVTMNQQVREQISKKEKVFLIISLLFIVYEIFIYCYFILTTLNGQLPFDLEAQEVGPVLYGQARLVFLIQIGLFGYSFYDFVKKNIVSNMLLNSNLTGIFLVFVHTSLLGNLADVTPWLHSFLEITGAIFMIGVVGALLQYIIMKKKRFF